MPEFQVRVYEPARGVRDLRVSAEHAGRVADALGVAPHHLLSVRPAEVGTGAGRSGRARLNLRLFAQELSVLLQAGIPLLEALQTLREKDSGATSLDPVLSALREGQPLSAALAQSPADFDELFIAVVSASERNGQIAATLRDHAAYLAWSEALRARLVAASVYPLMLLGAGGAVIVFLLLYVLPRFAGVFQGLGRDLPGASQMLMDLGVIAHAHPTLSIVIALMIPFTALAIWRWPPARALVGRWMWQAPWLGQRLRVLALARLYRCLALLLSAGVPVLSALRLAEGVLSAPLRPDLRAAVAQVAGGHRLSQAMQAHGLATPVALRMLRVGESSGEVASMFERAAAFHDEEIARLSELITRTVNPVLMLVMGVVIGGIVVLMYLPIFTLMEQVQ
jgi:general secretion pathway protein F